MEQLNQFFKAAFITTKLLPLPTECGFSKLFTAEEVARNSEQFSGACSHTAKSCLEEFVAKGVEVNG